jgi:alkanesulfonate monooxygenase SsuD/methylene tetrahydromethanopterin reductase-like flavin-dependent oxidoreductase (luciferase family)
MRIAVKHADMWSAYVTESSLAEAFAPMIERLNVICETQSREPSTLGRSIGIFVRPPDTPADVPAPGPSLDGSEDDIVRQIEQFAAIGATNVEIMVPGDMPSGFERLAGAVEKLASI